MRARPWLWYPAFATVTTVAYVVWGHPSILYDAVGFSAPVAVLVGVRLRKPAQRLPWILFAAGLFVYAAADLVALNYSMSAHLFPSVFLLEDGIAPFPAVTDALYLSVYIFLMAGVLALARARMPGGDRDSLIDALMLSIGIGTISYALLIAPYVHREDPFLEKATSMAYPLVALALLAAAVRVGLGAGRKPVALRMLIGSVAALFVTGSLYGWWNIYPDQGYRPGGPLELGWIAFYVLLGTAALHPSMTELSAPAPDVETRLTKPRLALHASGSLVAPVLLAVRVHQGSSQDFGPLIGATIAMALLVVVRMSGLIRQSHARFASLVKHSSDVVVVIDTDTTVGYASPSAERVLGYPPGELEGTRFGDLIHPEDRARVLAVLTSADDPEGSARLIEFRIRCKDGTNIDTETLRTSLLHDPNVTGIVVNIRDVSERTAFRERLVHQSFHDSLTQLANRALFRDRVTHALERQPRSGSAVTVLIVDLDDFKTLNDSLGHAAGDLVLRETGERLLRGLRSADTVARLGGDEFAILLEGDGVQAVEIADRIMQMLDEPFVLGGQEVQIRGSVGIAVAQDGGGDPDELLRNADIAMYMAKDGGKSRYQFFEPTMHEVALQRLELKVAMKHALERGEFRLHYQPVIELATGRIIGAEALIRWEHPDKGLIPPLEFVPLAEETGLIVPIGAWVLAEACAFAVRAQRAFPSDPPFHIAVNLSARQVARPEIVDDVREVLLATGLAPSALILEITESVMMQDMERAIVRLDELKALGAELAIDDFGTGYSSLNYLHRFPVDILKIDKSFVDGVTEGGEAAALTAAVIEMAAILNLKTVAEGIERDDQLQRLRELHCVLGQGYLFSKPVPPEAFEALLAADAWATPVSR